MRFILSSIPRFSCPAVACLLAITAACGCKEQPPQPTTSPAAAQNGEDPQVTKLGSIEVTAKLVEVPPGAIFKRDLYDYATILKYELIKTHRGDAPPAVFYVGHYNPFKPRDQAADRRVKQIGGTVKTFVPGQIHRMAMEVPIDDFFMGGIVNKYFGQQTGPLYWAVWTNSVEQ